MIAIIKQRYEHEFLKLCNDMDIMAIEMERGNDAILYDVHGESHDLFFVGMGIGIEMGEERMYEACTTINLN